MGRFKAEFFAQLGFARSNWHELRSEVMRIALENDAEAVETTEFGSKYVVRGKIAGPAGKKAGVLTVWIVLVGEMEPRFVTVYPEH